MMIVITYIFIWFVFFPHVLRAQEHLKPMVLSCPMQHG
jgi:hypothetical protein